MSMFFKLEKGRNRKQLSDLFQHSLKNGAPTTKRKKTVLLQKYLKIVYFATHPFLFDRFDFDFFSSRFDLCFDSRFDSRSSLNFIHIFPSFQTFSVM